MRRTKIVAAFVAAVMLLAAAAAAVASADIALPGAQVLQEQVNDFSSNAWQSDANRDTGFTTFKKSGATNRRLTSTSAFYGTYTLRFTVIFDSTASWNGNAKSMLFLSLSGDAGGGYSDFFIFFEQSIITGGEFAFGPANGYDPTLWRQSGMEGGFTEATGRAYDFMLEVKGGNTAELYIEKYGTPLLVSRYRAEAEEEGLFGGHIVFETGESGFIYEIGALSVDYSEEGLPKTFNSNFHRPGAIATVQGGADNTFISNYNTGNSVRRLDTQTIAPNQHLYSNFALTGKTFAAEYELSGIVNNNAWNNMTAAIEFVGGITDEKPDGVLLGQARKNYLSLGDHDWADLSIADGVNAGKFIDATNYKFKIEMTDGSYQMYISALIGGSYGAYVPFSSGDESFDDDNIGRIGVRANSPAGAAPITFKVKLLSLTGNISENIFLGTPDDSVLNPAFSGTLRMLLPEMPVFNPAKADERAVWSLEPTNLAQLSGGVLTADGAGELQLRLSAQSDPSVYRIFNVTIADATAPVIEFAQKYVSAAGGALAESAFWQNVTVTDNVSENVEPVLESITFYADMQDATDRTNGAPKAFDGGSLQLQRGVYEFTVSAADEAGNTAQDYCLYFVDAAILSGTGAYSDLEFTGAVIKLNLPGVDGLGGGFVFEVARGNAFIGKGGNEGKLLIMGAGETELTVINTLMPQLRTSFVFDVLDKQLPVITAYLPQAVRVGTSEADIKLGNMFEFSQKDGTIAVQYSVSYFSSKSDMERGENASAVQVSGGQFKAERAGWYAISVTAEDGSGNLASESFSFEAVSGAGSGGGSDSGCTGALSGSIAALIAALGAAWLLTRPVITKKNRA